MPEDKINFATTLVSINDEDGTEYHLTGKLMVEQENDWNGIRYQFDLDQCDFEHRTDEDQNNVTELIFYCHSAEDDILDCIKEDGDVYELTIRKSAYSGTPYLRIGCRVFKEYNAQNLYEFLCQRQDIKEYIDTQLAIKGCKPEFVVKLED